MRAAEPVVDVIVGVHNDRRPIERAVASALRNRLPIRVSVVAHNVDVALIRARLGTVGDDDRVRLLELQDGVRSPANAFNHGLDHATGEFVSIVGSDDELEEHALDEWVALADRLGADMVIAPVVRDGGEGVPTPRVRASRFGRIADPDRDRLFERAAALGLQRRAPTEHLRYATGLPRGEDQAYGLELWAGHRVVFDPRTPAYREHADQDDRITHVFGPLLEDFTFLDVLRPVLEKVAPAVRRAVAAKIVRVHLVPAIRVRAAAGSLTPEDRAAAAGVLRAMTDLAPSCLGLLPRTLAPEIRAASAAVAAPSPVRGRLGVVRDLLPIDLRALLHRHAPLRLQLAGRVVARRTARSAAARSRALTSGHGTQGNGDVVVVAPHGSPIADGLRVEHSAVVVGYVGSGASVEVPVPGARSRWFRDSLGDSFLGRLFSRLVGVDDSSRFAAAVRRTPTAEALLDRADLIVAADEDAVLASWRAARRGAAKSVVLGHAAAAAALAERTSR
ncbi:MAG: glycosyltransferase [Microbacterium sp.]|uniref:glycosyltransferase family 2 protein n=1 Tax=Microbacterium sp. TaxID=51671 RepID=UPI002620EC0D|nr:glycosyltransferase [Microbacterium sp.]MDF2559698.1 glycosyltransferase [Microbacterium sp.]